MTDIANQISTGRLIRDIEEGVIILDNTGTIVNLNPKALEILEIGEDYTDKKYVDLIDGDKNKNDAFHQMLVDAVVDKRIVHIGAFVLLLLFGFIYQKQRSIWGLYIPHFILGNMIEVLGLTET